MYIDGINLFTSHFIMGAREQMRKFTETETVEIEALHRWLNWKDSDWGMEKYSTDRTQYVNFLHEIDLEDFKQILFDLASIYKKEYPYSTKDDFLGATFSYTLFDIDRIVNHNYIWLQEPPGEKLFTFYSRFSRGAGEYLDYGIDYNRTIDFYKQYFRVVLSIINEFDYSAVSKSDNTKQHQKTPIKAIVFNNDVIEKIYKLLVGFFPDNASNLRRVLEGETLETPILFQGNQNKLVEFFRRLNYNGYVLSQPKDITAWLTTNFQFLHTKGEIKEVKMFNKNTVHDILTKGKGEAKKSERIGQVDWLPYKTHDYLKTQQREERL